MTRPSPASLPYLCLDPALVTGTRRALLSESHALITQVPPHPHEASRARQQLRAACAESDLPLSESELDRMESCTAEVLANAVVHAQTISTVTVRWSGRAVRVETHDANPRDLPRTSPGDDDESGRGLLMVQEMASRWGVEHTATGKTVWFEIDHHSVSDSAGGHKERPSGSGGRA